MRATKSLVLVALLCWLQPALRGQDTPRTLETPSPYHLLSTLRLSTMEHDVNETAARGYVAVGSWYSGQLVTLMTKAPESSGRAEYRLADSGGIRNVFSETGIPLLEQRLNEHGAEGFRLVPRTLTHMSRMRGQAVALMERRPGSSGRYEYVATVITADYDYLSGGRDASDRSDTVSASGTMSEESREALVTALGDAAGGGYTPVGLLTRRGITKVGWLRRDVLRVEHVVIAERRVDSSAASDPSAQAADRYRLVAGAPGADLQIALDAATAAGYRPRLVSTIDNPEVVLIMEKAADPGAGVECVLAGGLGTLTLDFQMNAAAARGFRAHGDGVFAEPPAVLMEKTPESTVHYEYRLLELMNSRSFEKDFADAVAEGWVPVGASHYSDMLFERVADTAPAAAAAPPAEPAGGFADRRGLLLHAFMRLQSLENELNAAAAEGYRVASDHAFVGLSVILQKPVDAPERYAYLAVADRNEARLAEKLNEAAARGFHVVRGGMTRRAATWGTETVVLLEKPPGGPIPVRRYHVVTATRLSTFQTELDQALRDGWRPIGLLGSASGNVAEGRVAILEKAGGESRRLAARGFSGARAAPPARGRR